MFGISQSYQGISAIFTKKIQEKRPEKVMCAIFFKVFLYC
ncbi:hypothetical protein SLUDD06_00024 [Streptococcus lutetiensis]|nr:hypothetical protein SLUDD06_00024 [Streptococcus lutetiensis]